MNEQRKLIYAVTMAAILAPFLIYSASAKPAYGNEHVDIAKAQKALSETKSECLNKQRGQPPARLFKEQKLEDAVRYNDYETNF